MADDMAAVAADAVAVETTSPSGQKKWTWPSLLRWIPSSIDHIIDSEKRLLSLVKYASISIRIVLDHPDFVDFWS